MNTKHSPHRRMIGLIWIALSSGLFAAGFTEPPIVINGLVIHAGEGASRPVYSGSLSMTLVRRDDPTHRVTRTTNLDAIGSGGGLSYRIEFPQHFLPETHQLSDHLATGAAEIEYRVESVTIDGIDAAPLDSARSLVALSFSNRAPLHRLDLRVALPEDDTDGDGMPDWWEEENGLNVNSPGDATSDTDSDGLDALTEYRRGSDPNVSNHRPLVQTTSLTVPIGGQAGLFLNIIDADTEPEDITVSFQNELSGLTIHDSMGDLANGTAVSYAQILSGEVRLKAERSFTGGAVALTVDDDHLPSEPIAASVSVEAYSPGNSSLGLWLDSAALAESHEPGDPVTEWPDLSGRQRDAYQPLASNAPTLAAGSLEFSGTEFLYLDDRHLDLSEFTALVHFKVDGFSDADQTVLSFGSLKLGIGGHDHPERTDSHYAIHNGRQVLGSHVPTHGDGQLTVTRVADALSIGFHAGHFFSSTVSTETLAAAFPTIGAIRPVSGSGAENPLLGKVSEILVFDQALDGGLRTRAEEYQRSRWDGLLVWDHRDDGIALNITGAAGVSNAISGGWGNDTLSGNNLADTLRGGPGADLLSGGDGPDRFHIFADHGDDTLLDFSEADGDVLDLTEIFGHLDDSPPSYLHFRSEIVRGDDNVPRMDSFLDLDHDGDGSGADQSIQFANQSFSDADLPRLVGEGSILLGGPRYETAVAISVDATAPTSGDDDALTIALTRTGNLDAALDVPLSFTGEAEIGADFTVSGADGAGAVCWASFPRGAADATFSLTPMPSFTTVPKVVAITVMADPQITERPAEPLLVPLRQSGQLVRIRTAGHVSLQGGAPGLVEVARVGDLSEPLEVDLQFGGTMANGTDYEAVSSRFSLPADTAVGFIVIIPKSAASQPDAVGFAEVELVADPVKFEIHGRGSATVQFLDGDLAGQTPSFAGWCDDKFPDDPRPDAELAVANDDNDSLANIYEYIRGSDATLATPTDGPVLSVSAELGFLVIRMSDVRAGLTDVELVVERSSSLAAGGWSDLGDGFRRSIGRRGNGRVDLVFTSVDPIAQRPNNEFFRVLATVHSDAR